MLRPNVAEAAQYYATVFMNQLILTRREAPLAHTLLLIYLALFSARVASAKGAPLGSRMLSSLLSGLHRAIPFCDAPDTKTATGELLASQVAPLNASFLHAPHTAACRLHPPSLPPLVLNRPSASSRS